MGLLTRLRTRTARRRAAARHHIARRLAEESERALAAWGTFPPRRRLHVLALLAPAAALRMKRRGLGPDEAAREELASQVARWAAGLGLGADGGAPNLDAVQMAFLAIGGSRRWPDQFLSPRPSAEFIAALEGALPVPLPPERPLPMAEQRL